ncbi:unnamed protein product [Mesocestoides corti]|uniref:Uncharacterized protein n=1 Tax=Mesocestoides corti TaxID=53468 RepID=A0A0R3UNI5_MESCO|nr:unnamed protein product [Mesocestoides corti]
MGQDQSRQEKFFDACSYGREWLVKEMISEGIDVNWKSNIVCPFNRFYTFSQHDCCPIHAASQGKPEIVRILIEAKCNIDARDINENTALHHAAMSGHSDCVKALLSAGASVNVSNNQFWTPLTNAAYWNHPEIVKLLLDRGADPFWKNKYVKAAALKSIFLTVPTVKKKKYIAISHYAKRSISLLNSLQWRQLRKLATDCDGRNPLHELCRSKSEDKEGLVTCLRLLLDRMKELEKTLKSDEKKPVTQNGHAESNSTPSKTTVEGHYKQMVLTDWVPLKPGDSSLELRSSPTNAWDSEFTTPSIYLLLLAACARVAWQRKRRTAPQTTLAPTFLASLNVASALILGHPHGLLPRLFTIVLADFTPLIFASYHGNCSLVETLLEMGADINAVDRSRQLAVAQTPTWHLRECSIYLPPVLGASVNLGTIHDGTPVCVVQEAMRLRKCYL